MRQKKKKKKIISYGSYLLISLIKSNIKKLSLYVQVSISYEQTKCQIKVITLEYMKQQITNLKKDVTSNPTTTREEASHSLPPVRTTHFVAHISFKASIFGILP